MCEYYGDVVCECQQGQCKEGIALHNEDDFRECLLRFDNDPCFAIWARESRNLALCDRIVNDAWKKKCTGLGQ